MTKALTKFKLLDIRLRGNSIKRRIDNIEKEFLRSEREWEQIKKEVFI